MPNGAPARPPARFTLTAACGLVVAIAAAYAHTFRAPFEFDDFTAITANPTIRRLWPCWDIFSPPHELGSTVGGRPVLNLTFAFNYAISGDAVWSYHLFNLAIHIGAALLLFGITRRTLWAAALPVRFRGGGEGAPAGGGHHATLAAFAIAALWAVHPLSTEAVTYVAQRAESLASFLYLFALYAFIRATGETGHARPNGPPEPRARNRAARSWLAVSVAACLLGVGTKEIVATAPVLVLLYDRTFVAGSFAAAWRARWRYHVALATSWIVVGALVASTHDRGGTAGFGAGVSVWSYLLTQSHAIVRYLRLALWPHAQVFDYGTALAPGLAAVWPYALIVVGMLVATAVALVRAPRAGFAAAAFFVLLAPSSSFVPVGSQTMAEHRMYLPLAAGVALIVIAAMRWLGPRALAAALLLGMALGTLTYARNAVYRSDLELWADTVAHAPNNARAHNNLGNALVRRSRFAAALPHYETAVRLQPDYVDAQSNLAHVLVQLGRATEALPHAELAARLQPESADVLLNYGLALGRNNRTADAVRAFEKALQLSPASADAKYDLGNAYYRLHEYQSAARLYRDLLQQQPQRYDARFNLAYALLQLGQPDAALVEFETLARQFPNDADAHAEAGNLLAHLGRTREALAHFETALRLKPDFPAVRQQLEQLQQGPGVPAE